MPWWRASPAACCCLPDGVLRNVCLQNIPFDKDEADLYTLFNGKLNQGRCQVRGPMCGYPGSHVVPEIGSHGAAGKVGGHGAGGGVGCM